MTRGAFAPLAALGVLVDHGVRFVLIGGLAGRTFGSNLITNDLDICYERTPVNVARLVDSLREMNARLRGVEEEVPFILEPATILAGDTFTFETDLGALDCIGTPTGTDGYGQLIKGASEVGMGVFTVSVASLDDLIAMKEATGRPKDREAIEVLAALEEERRSRADPDPS